MKSLRISEAGAQHKKIRTIINALASGLSVEQILAADPALTYSEIFRILSAFQIGSEKSQSIVCD